MKKHLLPLLFTLLATAAFAQPEVADQNPDFRISRTRYMAAKDSLLRGQSTTVQDTYKAYDWMQLRQERKDTRFQNRQQRRLNRSMYGDFNFYQPYGLGINYNGNYRNRYYGNYYNNRYRSGFSNLWWWFLF